MAKTAGLVAKVRMVLANAVEQTMQSPKSYSHLPIVISLS